MTNPDDPGSILQIEGLTKREYFAAMAMQGIFSTNRILIDSNIEMAVKVADALIAELNKDNKNIS